MASKPETNFRKIVTDWLKTHPDWFQMSIQQVAIVGSPDKILCIDGLFIALELKSLCGVVTPMQARILDEIEKAGGISLVASPGNWDEVKPLLRALAGTNPLGLRTKIRWREINGRRTIRDSEIRKRKKQRELRTRNVEADEDSDRHENRVQPEEDQGWGDI